MRKQSLRLALVLAIMTVVLVGVASVAHAQVTQPAECRMVKYDINGDGKLTWADLDQWKLTFRANGCQLGQRIGQCPAQLDLDNNGVVNRADLDKLINTYFLCSRPPSFTGPGR